MTRMLPAAAAAASLLVPVAASAKVKGEKVDYKQGDTVLEGYIAYDDSKKGPRPAVIVVHEWKGPGEYTRKRAEQLAALGYVGFAADIYGKDVRPKDHAEAGKAAGMFRSDRELMRARILAAVEQVKKDKRVDPKRIAAIGYCFGGSAVLELARSGADVRFVGSFHGSLDTSMPAKEGAVKATVVAFHGAEDKGVNPAVPGFIEEMRAAKADWALVQFGNAVHGFTVSDRPEAYDEKADRRSWRMLEGFLKEAFE